MAFFGLRHLGLKLLSIALAALLWLLVSGEQIVERAMRIRRQDQLHPFLPQLLHQRGAEYLAVGIRDAAQSGDARQRNLTRPWLGTEAEERAW